MNKCKKIFFTTLFLLSGLIPFTLFAQNQNEIEMADTLRSEGKIYVVVAVISVILLGLLTYLIMIDRKVNKMEKRIKGEK